MGAEKVIANLLRVAKEDLDGARSLAKHGNRNAIYLCEQAAEKVILAVVTSEGNIKAAPGQVEFDRHAANVAHALDAAVAGFKVDLAKANAPAGSVTPLR